MTAPAPTSWLAELVHDFDRSDDVRVELVQFLSRHPQHGHRGAAERPSRVLTQKPLLDMEAGHVALPLGGQFTLPVRAIEIAESSSRKGKNHGRSGETGGHFRHPDSRIRSSSSGLVGRHNTATATAADLAAWVPPTVPAD